MYETLQYDPAAQGSSTCRNKHNKAFSGLSTFVETEIIQNQKPKRANQLMNLYKQEYTATGGSSEDFESYTCQALTVKLKNRFGNQIIIAKGSNKEGNLIYPAEMTHDEAKSYLDDADDELAR